MPYLESEKELEDFLFNAFGPDWPLEDPGGRIFRQVTIPGYGVVDMVAVDITVQPLRPMINVTIYELKKGVIDNTAVAQIARYKAACERILGENTREFDYQVNGVLVGESIAPGDVCFLIDYIDWLTAYDFDFSLGEGLKFSERSGWRRIEEDLSFVPLVDEMIGLYKEVLIDTRRHDRLQRKIKENRRRENNNEFLDCYNVEEGSA